ncbi:hypothetical protein [Streptomyces smaragdinus]|uniref:hypothetical protein n=1 Tax=Streptomyces smaragdinus TaxID=2585196 RepID=UPI00389A7DE9
MILLEALSSMIIGFGLAMAAVRRWPARFPQRLLTLATGPAAALVGAGLTHSALGGDEPVATVVVAGAVAAALLSLLVRDGKRATRAVTADVLRL